MSKSLAITPKKVIAWEACECIQENNITDFPIKFPSGNGLSNNLFSIHLYSFFTLIFIVYVLFIFLKFSLQYVSKIIMTMLVSARALSPLKIPLPSSVISRQHPEFFQRKWNGVTIPSNIMDTLVPCCQESTSLKETKMGGRRTSDSLDFVFFFLEIGAGSWNFCLSPL